MNSSHLYEIPPTLAPLFYHTVFCGLHTRSHSICGHLNNQNHDKFTSQRHNRDLIFAICCRNINQRAYRGRSISRSNKVKSVI